MKLGALVLAAGKGTRMFSEIPKVLQTLLGEPMLYYVHSALSGLGNIPFWTIIGHGADMVSAAFPEHKERFILQEQQLGTGHAVQIAMPVLDKSNIDGLLVVNGDTPLVSTGILSRFLSLMEFKNVDLGFISITLEDPKAYGRVVRDHRGQVAGIVEYKEFNAAEHGLATGEINTGIYYFSSEVLRRLLPQLTNNNKSGEFYITDLVTLAVQDGLKVEAVNFGNEPCLLGVNTPLELSEAESNLRQRINREWMERGVMLHMPDMITIGPRVVLEPGVRIYGPSEILNASELHHGSCVESHCVVRDTQIETGTVVHSFSHLECAKVGEHCSVGPYARLRPGSVMKKASRIGNFVEMKKATLGEGAKANHLSYLGDADVGARSNIGAGTITCNYDGVNKHATCIGEGAFIGSNTALIAPVSVGPSALIGAGSIITKDVPEGMLALTRAPQKMFPRKKK